MMFCSSLLLFFGGGCGGGGGGALFWSVFCFILQHPRVLKVVSVCIIAKLCDVSDVCFSLFFFSLFFFWGGGGGGRACDLYMSHRYLWGESFFFSFFSR